MEKQLNALRKRLSRNVRALRQDIGLSQEALAFEADVDRTYVSQIERGIGNPSLLVLCKLAAVLNVSVPELLQ
jgi:transcriptional regulator with XRE-family HTH domain